MIQQHHSLYHLSDIEKLSTYFRQEIQGSRTDLLNRGLVDSAEGGDHRLVAKVWASFLVHLYFV